MFNKQRFLIFVLGCGLLTFGKIYGQQSVDLFGFASNKENSRFRLNSFELNPGNYTNTKDWGFSVVYGNTFATTTTNNIYLVSLSKRFGNHFFYARYTPGIQKEFIYNIGAVINEANSSQISTNLKRTIKYQELFGLGYSYKSKKFNAGFSLRYFSQTFTEDKLVPFFSDTLNFINIDKIQTHNNFWRGDIGVNFSPYNNLTLSLSSINLFIVHETSDTTNRDAFLRTDKGAQFGLNYSPFKNFGLFGVLQTNKSFITGMNFASKIFGGTLTFGMSILHDNYRKYFIAGIVPVLNYSSNLFSITLSGIKYFNNSSVNTTVDDFFQQGVHNILNNQYSNDKIFLGVSIALSFAPEKHVKFINLKILNNLYPAFDDYYSTHPFAVAKVKNITDKPITVKPSCKINRINNEFVYSPAVNIAPNDTANVEFYTNVNNIGTKIKHQFIAQVNFELTTTNSEPDDKLQKPILVNDMNGWDGNVSNLRYFVTSDLTFAQKYAKNILHREREKLIKVLKVLSKFEKVKILFNQFVKGMIYVSDPRGSSDKVQYPHETIELKGGDCDDFSVAFSSFLESIGIQTAFVDYKSPDGISHVNLLINTELTPEQAPLISINDKRYIIRKNITGKDEVWIPLEMTSLTNFNTAWTIGAKKFNKEAINDLGLVKGKVAIIDVY